MNIIYLLGFIEVLRNLASLEGVNRAEDDENHVVKQRHDDREGGHLVMLWMVWILKINL